MEALAGRKAEEEMAGAMVAEEMVVVVALSVAVGAATVVVVAVAGMGAVGVAAATRLTREVGAGAAGLAVGVGVVAAACALGAEALRCCRAVLAVMVRSVLEAASVRWRPLMRVDAASR